jgi:ADP-ribose pyrophosphatase YjhB (NUDIX family)
MCGNEISLKSDHGIERNVCDACGYTHYRNPAPAVGVIIETGDGIALVRRKFEPFRGKWSIPAGFMEFEEGADETAARETKEETGLDIGNLRLLGVYKGVDDPRTKVILVVYIADMQGGTYTAGDDAEEIKFFKPEALPEPGEMAFRAHILALQDYLKQRKSLNPRRPMTSS